MKSKLLPNSPEFFFQTKVYDSGRDKKSKKYNLILELISVSVSLHYALDVR